MKLSFGYLLLRFVEVLISGTSRSQWAKATSAPSATRCGGTSMIASVVGPVNSSAATSPCFVSPPNRRWGRSQNTSATQGRQKQHRAYASRQKNDGWNCREEMRDLPLWTTKDFRDAVVETAEWWKRQCCPSTFTEDEIYT